MRLAFTLAAVGAAALALTLAALYALAHAVWFALSPVLRYDLARLNWATISTMVLLIVVCPVLMSLDDRKR